MDVETFKKTEEINRKTYQERYNNPDNSHCKAGCPFWRPLHQRIPLCGRFCAYSLIARRLRQCNPEQCNVSQRVEEFNAIPNSQKAFFVRKLHCDPGIIRECEEEGAMM